MPQLNFSGLFRKLGIESDSITTGPHKDIDSPYKPRSEEERKLLQDLINVQFEQFLAVVKAGRPAMSAQTVRELSDGRIVSAREAKERGLIDDIGYLDDAYRRIGELSGFPRNSLVRYANAWQTGNNIYSNTFPVEIFGN
jgi:protease-4